MKYPRMPEHLDRRRKMLSVDIALAKKMRRQGASYASIGRRFGVSETAAKYWTNSDFREHAKEQARNARRELWLTMSPEQKADAKRASVETMMRKRKIQPEYKEYADDTHYRYAATPKASETRKKYWQKNKSLLNERQKRQYLNHREIRQAGQRAYYQKNKAEILRKSKEHYLSNRHTILQKNKEKRAQK